MLLHIREIKIKWGSNFAGLWLMEANKNMTMLLTCCKQVWLSVFASWSQCLFYKTIVSSHTTQCHHNVLVVLKLILSVACWICLHAASSISIGSLTNWKLKAKYRINMWYPVCPAVCQPRCFLRAKCDLSDQNIAPHVSCVTVTL